MKKILKIIILSPIFLIGALFMIIGALGVSILVIGETIMRKIGAL